MRDSSIAAVLVAFAISTAPLPALAATITFDAAAPGVYAGHAEAGFDVTPTGGSWEQFILGAPLYSIVSLSANASLMLSASDGSPFAFGSIDLRSFVAGGGYGSEGGGSGVEDAAYTYVITGFHSGSSVLSIAGSISRTAEFVTVAGTDAVALDELAITFTAISSGFNLDNIVLVEPIPEPGTAISIGFGLFVLGARARRRRALT